MEMNDDNVMDRTRYTYKERTLLLRLRRKPRDWTYLQAVAKVDDDAMNVMLTRLEKLYYVEGKAEGDAEDDAEVEDKPEDKAEDTAAAETERKPEGEARAKTGMIHLNQMGETVAQAEFDHRFELYFNRAISFLALLVSIAAIVVSVI